MNYCPLKKYKDILGVPGKGAHSYRIMNVPVVDYILTIFLAFFLSFITKIPVELTTIFSFILGVLLHIIFGVSTTTTTFLGIKC
jgi:hypothetical protein